MTLAENAEKYLQIINSNPDRWLSRVELAQLAGKKRLNPAEIVAVDYLADQGLIQRESVKVGGVIKQIWIYRARPNGA